MNETWLRANIGNLTQSPTLEVWYADTLTPYSHYELERKTRLELATFYSASKRSTN